MVLKLERRGWKKRDFLENFLLLGGLILRPVLLDWEKLNWNYTNGGGGWRWCDWEYGGGVIESQETKREEEIEIEIEIEIRDSNKEIRKCEKMMVGTRKLSHWWSSSIWLLKLGISKFWFCFCVLARVSWWSLKMMVGVGKSLLKFQLSEIIFKESYFYSILLPPSQFICYILSFRSVPIYLLHLQLFPYIVHRSHTLFTNLPSPPP